jgi:hypothetical protein
VIELANSVNPAGFYALLARHGVTWPDSDDVPVYLQPQDYLRPGCPDGTYLENRVSWPSPAVAQFQQWVKRLRSSDDRLLDGLQFPASRSLREIAADPLAFGFILEHANPKQLRGLLADPDVKSVSIGDVAFNLGAAG